MTGLDRINKKIHDTYYDPKNKQVLPTALFFGVLAIITKAPLFWETLIWGIYYLYCSHNNEKWRKLPYNIEQRERLLEFRRKILSGEIKFDNEE